jgi:hypothetical protein
VIKVQKDVNELLELQDRAIQALQQATLALQIALQALQDSRVEKGDQQKMVFVPVPAPAEKVPYVPYVQPFSPYKTLPYVGDIVTTTVTGVGVAIGSGGFQTFNGSAADAVKYALNSVQTATAACAGSNS